jgi:hypothetical protein
MEIVIDDSSVPFWWLFEPNCVVVRWKEWIIHHHILWITKRKKLF